MPDTSLAGGHPPAAPFGGLDPHGITTPGAYVERLRQVRAASGLTFRQVERLARSAGRQLPASTLATVLARPALPREDVIVAFISACGGDDSTVATWVAVRRRLAAAAVVVATPSTEAEAEAGAGAEGEAEAETGAEGGGETETRAEGETETEAENAAGRRETSPWLRWPVALTALAAVMILGGVSWWLASRQDTAPGGAQPVAGGYRIQSAHSGLCLSERPGGEDGRIFQAPCPEAFPALSLAPLGEGLFQIHTDHPQFGPGCMGVPDATTEAGAPISDDFCTEPDAKQFRLEPVSGPLTGYRLRAVHSGLCVAVAGDSAAAWADVMQLPCDPAAPGQVFTFDPR